MHVDYSSYRYDPDLLDKRVAAAQMLDNAWTHTNGPLFHKYGSPTTHLPVQLYHLFLLSMRSFLTLLRRLYCYPHKNEHFLSRHTLEALLPRRSEPVEAPVRSSSVSFPYCYCSSHCIIVAFHCYLFKGFFEPSVHVRFFSLRLLGRYSGFLSSRPAEKVD